MPALAGGQARHFLLFNVDLATDGFPEAQDGFDHLLLTISADTCYGNNFTGTQLKRDILDRSDQIIINAQILYFQQHITGCLGLFLHFKRDVFSNHHLYHFFRIECFGCTAGNCFARTQNSYLVGYI